MIQTDSNTNQHPTSDALPSLAHVFVGHEALAAQLLPWAIDANSTDGSHDLAHIARVWANAKKIAELEGGDLEVLVAAVILHDCVAVEKNSPLRSKASQLAAARATELLTGLGWRKDRCALVAHAIEAHSFSAGIDPQTLEACIVQDADRLDAIGLIGVARCFYTAGRMQSQLYDVADPKAMHRALQDKTFALDHFASKLLTLSENFRTRRGGALAKQRHRLLAEFYDGFLSEI